MLFSYNWLNQYLAYEVSPEELAKLLTMHSYEVEEIKKRGEDVILDIDVLPNRAADSFSHQGIAREANAILASMGKYKEKKAKECDTKTTFSAFTKIPEGTVPIEIEHTKDAPLYYMASIENVQVGESPEWLKNYLKAVGLDAINNLVDIANFVMLDVGQPLHIFDANKINGTIHVRRAREGETVELIGGEKKQLSGEDIVVADEKSVLGIAGIKGGAQSAVTHSTTSILIEAAKFHKQSIYKSAKRLNLQTDAAKRFAADFAPELLPLGLYRTIELIKELAGGRNERISHQGTYQFFTERPYVMVGSQTVSEALGVSLKEDTIFSILNNIGCQVKREKDTQTIKVTPPFWRQDIEIPEDIYEEVARVHGLENIPVVFPSVSLAEPHENEAVEWRTFVREHLIRQGISEVYNYTLGQDKKGVELLNFMSEKRKYLRRTLEAGLLENIELNQKFADNGAIFEIGNTFTQKGKDIIEREMLGIAVFTKDSPKETFRELRGYVEALLEAMGFDRDDYFMHHEGKALNLVLEGKEVGSLYLPEGDRKIKNSVALFECSMEDVIKEADMEREFEEPPKFPSVVRDISLLLKGQVKVESILSIIQEIGKDLVEDVDLFDTYEGQEAKSMAFHVMYRSKEKTLTDKEINTLHQKIETELKKRLNVEVR